MALENAHRSSATFDDARMREAAEHSRRNRDELSSVYLPRFARAASERQERWPTITVVIPTLNEARNLPVVLAELPDDLHEIVIVDGHSTDGTVEVARRACARAKIVLQTGKGKGDALRCGFEASTGDIIVMFDADGSADPAEISRFITTLFDGADFAKGTRFAPGGGSSDITPLRRIGNYGLSQTVNLLFGTRYTDLCYGYNAFWRHCLPVLDVDCSGFEIETLINIRVGRAKLDVREVPSFERGRIYGQSNLRTFRDGARVLRTILSERLRRPGRLRPAPHPHRMSLPHPSMELAADEPGI